MTPEARLWNTLKRTVDALPYPTHIVRVENLLSEGHPDVQFCVDGRAGVIELKTLPAWPKRVSTIVKIRHFTSKQRDFLSKYSLAGGRSHLLLQVGDGDKEPYEYLLFSGAMCLLVGKLTREEVKEAATYCGCNMGGVVAML